MGYAAAPCLPYPSHGRGMPAACCIRSWHFCSSPVPVRGAARGCAPASRPCRFPALCTSNKARSGHAVRAHRPGQLLRRYWLGRHGLHQSWEGSPEVPLRVGLSIMAAPLRVSGRGCWETRGRPGGATRGTLGTAGLGWLRLGRAGKRSVLWDRGRDAGMGRDGCGCPWGIAAGALLTT